MNKNSLPDKRDFVILAILDKYEFFWIENSKVKFSSFAGFYAWNPVLLAPVITLYTTAAEEPKLVFSHVKFMHTSTEEKLVAACLQALT